MHRDFDVSINIFVAVNVVLEKKIVEDSIQCLLFRECLPFKKGFAPYFDHYDYSFIRMI